MTRIGTRIFKLKCVAFSLLLLAAVSGCATLGDKISGVEKGVFLDGPVGGLTYKTPTLEGVTKADGIFRYKPGEAVTFSVGGLVLGSTEGKKIVTPLNLFADAKDASDQRVVNVCVFLQSLDQDGNPENGILITEQVAAVVAKLGGQTVFNKPVRAFSFDAGFRSVMAELNEIDAFGAPRAVRPPGVAQKHLEATLAGLKK